MTTDKKGELASLWHMSKVLKQHQEKIADMYESIYFGDCQLVAILFDCKNQGLMSWGGWRSLLLFQCLPFLSLCFNSFGSLEPETCVQIRKGSLDGHYYDIIT